MDKITIEPTEFSPRVVLDASKSKYEISGESRPENPAKFFHPILKWLEQYQSVLFFQKTNYKDNPEIAFEFKLEYFNSTSAKYIFDVIKVLNNYFVEGYNAKIKWHYDERDEDMMEAGQELEKLVKVPFEFIGY